MKRNLLISAVIFTNVFIFMTSMAQKFTIQVDVKISEPEYLDNYDPDEIKFIEELASDSIRELLSIYLPIFDFVTDPDVTDKMTFIVARRDNDLSKEIFSVDLKTTLSGDNVIPCNPLNIPFAPEGSFHLYLGDAQNLGTTIVDRIRVKLKQDIHQKILIDSLFSFASITNELDEIDFAQKKWRFKQTYIHWNVDDGSKFVIVGNYKENKDSIPRSYLSITKRGLTNPNSKILTEATKDQPIDPIGKHSRQTHLEILRVHLIWYAPLKNNPSTFRLK